MKQKKRRRLRINDDTMTTIVAMSLVFCVGIVVMGFVFVWNDKDISSLIPSALGVFGTELGICGLMKISERNNEASDRRAEERRQRETVKKERENAEKEDFLKG